jgi:hypothetical protein
MTIRFTDREDLPGLLPLMDQLGLEKKLINFFFVLLCVLCG